MNERARETAAPASTAIRVARSTPSIEDARLTLARLLVGKPPPHQVLAAAAALATLDDTAEPSRPLDDEIEPLPWNEGSELALAQLRSAIDEATTIQGLTRIATAALELRSGSTPAGEDR
jgi:hypothetical protein